MSSNLISFLFLFFLCPIPTQKIIECLCINSLVVFCFFFAHYSFCLLSLSPCRLRPILRSHFLSFPFRCVVSVQGARGMAICCAGGLWKTWPFFCFHFVGCNVMSNVSCFFSCSFCAYTPFLCFSCARRIWLALFFLLSALSVRGDQGGQHSRKIWKCGVLGGIGEEFCSQILRDPGLCSLFLHFQFCEIAG